VVEGETGSKVDDSNKQGEVTGTKDGAPRINLNEVKAEAAARVEASNNQDIDSIKKYKGR